MSRTPIPFFAPDISAFARSLRQQLLDLDDVPGHVEMLNLLARGAGFRNFQDLKAKAAVEAEAAPPVETASATEPSAAEPPPSAPPRNDGPSPMVQRLLRCFDAEGRLLRWPARRTDQVNALWVLWSRMPANTDLSEREVNQRLIAWNAFEDHAILRRELVTTRLMRRTPDGSRYRRIEQPVPPELQGAISQLQMPA